MRGALGAGVFGAVLTLAAATFDTLPLFVPGLALVTLGLLSGAWVLVAAAGASVERTLGPHSVLEDEPYAIHISARTGPLPAPGGELADPLVDQPLSMLGRRSRHVTIQVRFGRRGRRALGPTRLAIRDPLGLAGRQVSSEAAEVLVLPRVEPVVVSGHGGAARGIDAGSLAAASAELELDSLRPYRPGAPASRIHWPTVARAREVMERRLVADEDTRPLVVLDARRPVSEEALDRAVRAAASLALHLGRAGGCGVLLPGDRRATALEPDLRAWSALHARLAVVEADDQPPAAARVAQGGALFWVTTAAGGEAPAGLRRAAAQARYLVTPVPRPGAAGFTVADCHGYRVGRAGTRERAAA